MVVYMMAVVWYKAEPSAICLVIRLFTMTPTVLLRYTVIIIVRLQDPTALCKLPSYSATVVCLFSFQFSLILLTA